MTYEGPMRRPNIVLVVMDTARFSHVSSGLSEYMPNLSTVASDGTTFQNCMATAPWTLPSHASMFTGQYTSTHLTHAGSTAFDPDTRTLATRLTERGYDTVAYSNNTWISPDFGFDRGFDEFLTRWQLVENETDIASIAKATTLRDRLGACTDLVGPGALSAFINLCYSVYLSTISQNDSGGERTTKRLCRWINRHDGDTPFFLFVNYVEPHLPYDPPDPFRDRFQPANLTESDLDSVQQDPWRYITGEITMTSNDFEALDALYRSELAYLDSQLGNLFESLRDAGVYDETVIAVVGDHGENIGDHGLMDHQYCLYDTLLHVPLILMHPTRTPPGSTVEGLVELRDIYPTLLESAGDLPDDGRNQSTNSLLDPTERTIAREWTGAEYLEPQPSMEALSKHVDDISKAKQYDRALRAIRTDEWKLIESTDGEKRLYDLETDPHETTDVAADHPSIVRDLADNLTNAFGPFRRNPDSSDVNMSDDTKRRLEELGYLR